MSDMRLSCRFLYELQVSLQEVVLNIIKRAHLNAIQSIQTISFLSLILPGSLFSLRHLFLDIRTHKNKREGFADRAARAQLHQALLDLTNPFTVLCVAAHPDDEDGSTLTVLRRKYGVHTVSLFSTYGEGGQNAVGPELYEELGVIRARETIAAAEVQGSEPHFLGMKDFGFSKSAEETFRAWGEKGSASSHGPADSPTQTRCGYYQSRHNERTWSSPGDW